MSEQEIKNLRQEMIALTKSVNDYIIKSEAHNTEAIETAKRATEVAYVASSNNNSAVKELKTSIQGIQDTLEPIAKIYINTVGFGKVTKYIFFGLSFIVGLIISIRTLLPNSRLW